VPLGLASAPPMPRPRLFPAFAWPGLALASLCLVVACRIDSRASKDAVAIVGRGIVNSPSNKSLRFDLIRFGLKQFCDELLLGGAPIRISDDQPVVGRYFASSCEAKSLDDPGRRTIIAKFSGQGFAYSAATGRLGFRAGGLIEVAPDFRIHESALYVYFRPIQVDTSDFALLMTERQLARVAADLAQVDEAKVGQLIINAQLGRGFTVIRYDADGNSDFALGLIAPGERPFRPFTVLESPRRTLANGRTEIFPGQQDFLGKLRVESGQALTLTLRLEGASAVDVLVLSAEAGAETIQKYLSQPGPAAVTGGVVFQAKLAPGAPLRGTFSPPAGDYYLLLDDSDKVGQVAPPSGALPARIDYLLQVGE
jgi:hypothetical protein